jgi:hypothetical protein
MFAIHLRSYDAKSGVHISIKKKFIFLKQENHTNFTCMKLSFNCREHEQFRKLEAGPFVDALHDTTSIKITNLVMGKFCLKKAFFTQVYSS